MSYINYIVSFGFNIRDMSVTNLLSVLLKSSIFTINSKLSIIQYSFSIYLFISRIYFFLRRPFKNTLLKNCNIISNILYNKSINKG